MNKSNIARFLSGTCLVAAISASGAMLVNYMADAPARIEGILEIYQNAARCASLNAGPQEVQYHCEEAWQRYNRLNSGLE